MGQLGFQRKETMMDKWEYQIMVSTMSGILKPDISPIWETVGADGVTDLQRIQKWGEEGWEIVSVLPIASGNGSTQQVTWIFKRKKPEPEV
jgi:hypothetical protein